MKETSQATSTETSAKPASTDDEADLREKIETDLKTWQEKFAKAADKGRDDLEERVKEITAHQIRSQAHSVGEALIVQLEETSKTALDSLKSRINRAVKGLPEQPTENDIESVYEEINSHIRSAGLTVREKAQALRSWKENYDQETQNLVKAACNSTLEVIDNIRDLGLQEIGMRWAWMEGVTYKDWSKYHALKKTFDEWRNKVEAVAMHHEGLSEAKHEGDKIEEKGMAVAEDAARELARLKDVANWKLRVQDTSDDFSTRKMPAAAAKAAQQVADKISDVSSAVAGSSQGTMGSIASVASESAADVASSASSAVVNTEAGVVEHAATKVSEAILGSQAATDSVVSVASSKVRDASAVADRSLRPRAQSILSAAKFKKDQASSSVIGTPAPAHESILSRASSSIESVSSVVSEALPGVDAKSASSKVWGGAMAQSVDTKKVVYIDDIIEDDDGDITYSERLQSAFSAAGDKATDLTRAISEAIRKPSSTQIIQGAVESMTSLASEQYERALLAASSVLYGTEQVTEQGTMESMSSVASDKYAQAVTA